MEAATNMTMTMAMSMSITSPSPFFSYHSLSFPSASIHRYRSPTKLRKKTGFGFGFPITMVKVKASSDSNSTASDSSSVNAIAPLELKSPIGQFLSEILTTRPHLLPAAVDQQLQLLQQQAQHPSPSSSSSSSSTDLVLYRRIAEVQANERRTTLEEILYAMVVQRFMDANVSLTPSIGITPSSTNIWPPHQQQEDDEKLERLHSSEANEMIQNHLSLILGNHNRIGDYASVAKISKLRVGQVYAASLMYGYFLKRVDERFQLEKTVKVLSNATEEEKEEEEEEEEEGENHFVHPEVEISSSSMPGEFGIKPSRLRTYVMSFDGETLQRFATIRSKEAVAIIEKHTEALFGGPSPDIVIDSDSSKEKDQVINITFGGLKRLVLEAVTFGSFLWDVETYVDSRYHFVTN